MLPRWMQTDAKLQCRSVRLCKVGIMCDVAIWKCNVVWFRVQVIKAFFGKNSRFCTFSEVCASFQLFVWTFVQPTKFTSDMSVFIHLPSLRFQLHSHFPNWQWLLDGYIKFRTNRKLFPWKINRSLSCL